MSKPTLRTHSRRERRSCLSALLVTSVLVSLVCAVPRLAAGDQTPASVETAASEQALAYPASLGACALGHEPFTAQRRITGGGPFVPHRTGIFELPFCQWIYYPYIRRCYYSGYYCDYYTMWNQYYCYPSDTGW